jgi:hypothetical protein
VWSVSEVDGEDYGGWEILTTLLCTQPNDSSVEESGRDRKRFKIQYKTTEQSS